MDSMDTKQVKDAQIAIKRDRKNVQEMVKKLKRTGTKIVELDELNCELETQQRILNQLEESNLKMEDIRARCHKKYKSKESIPKAQAGSEQRSVEISLRDAKCLDPGKFLNEKVIDFWMNHVYLTHLTNRERKESFVFSSGFYKAIRNHFEEARDDTDSDMDTCRWAREARGDVDSNLCKWTKDIPADLFAKDFLFIPILEASHWVLAVVSFPRLVASDVVETEEDDDVEELSEPPRVKRKLVEVTNNAQWRGNVPKPRIIILDSFADFNMDRDKIAENIRLFLSAEWEKKEESSKVFDSVSLPLSIPKPKAPQQNNPCDSGILALMFYEAFYTWEICNRPNSCWFENWFTLTATGRKREQIFQVISSVLKQRLDQVIGKEESCSNHVNHIWRSLPLTFWCGNT